MIWRENLKNEQNMPKSKNIQNLCYLTLTAYISEKMAPHPFCDINMPGINCFRIHGIHATGNLPDCPETVQTVLKLSRLSRNCPNWAETFQTVRKLSRLSGNFRPFLENSPHCLKNFYSVQALFEF